MKTKVADIKGKLFRCYVAILSNGHELLIDKDLADYYRGGSAKFIQLERQYAEDNIGMK